MHTLVTVQSCPIWTANTIISIPTIAICCHEKNGFKLVKSSGSIKAGPCGLNNDTMRAVGKFTMFIVKKSFDQERNVLGAEGYQTIQC